MSDLLRCREAVHVLFLNARIWEFRIMVLWGFVHRRALVGCQQEAGFLFFHNITYQCT